MLVTADLRASEESQDGKKTIIGRILEKAVSRKAANTEFDELAQDVSKRQADIVGRHLGSQLVDLGKELTEEVGAFTARREVRLNATTPDVRPSPTHINVMIADATAETSVSRQGHGFQRALLISSLKLLAKRGAADKDGSVILLAIEEPELFQHPTQARVFATVLRDLAQMHGGGMQVAYATHSPFFVDPRYFDQIRRVSRSKPNKASHQDVAIYRASMDAVAKRISGFVTERSPFSLGSSMHKESS